MKIVEKERELAKVPIKKEDVELIIRELEVTKQIAERTLRESGGNLESALTTLVHSWLGNIWRWLCLIWILPLFATFSVLLGPTPFRKHNSTSWRPFTKSILYRFAEHRAELWRDSHHVLYNGVIFAINWLKSFYLCICKYVLLRCCNPGNVLYSHNTKHSA